MEDKFQTVVQEVVYNTFKPVLEKLKKKRIEKQKQEEILRKKLYTPE